MRVAGMGWVTGEICGSLRRGQQQKYENPRSLYQQLEQAGIFSLPLNKVRWFNTVSQRYCLASALALQDTFEDSAGIRLAAPETGVLSVNREGALEPNLEYFKDYVHSGRKLARGNLFIYTLPTSPLAETAIAFGFKGPIFHLSAAGANLNLLFDRAAALARRARTLNLLCCVADKNSVISFFLKPDQPETGPGISSLAEMKSRAGHLQSLKDVFQTLKIETEMIRS